MKILLAFVLLHILAFQVTDQLDVSNVTTAADDPVLDYRDSEISTYNSGNMGNTSTGSMEETDQRSSGTNTTLPVSDITGQDFFPNDTTRENGAGRKRPVLFHDDVKGTVVVILVAIMIAGVFLSPLMTHYCNKYKCKKQVSVTAQPDVSPRYQDLVRRDNY